MTWCSYCGKDCQTGHDYATGSICCAECGKLISQNVFVDEPTFCKGAGGESRVQGTYVKSILGDDSDSHRRTLEKGNTIIYELIDQFGITDVQHATAFYRIAVERSFTKGRRTSQVAAACLYIACREKEKSFLLIDFSSHLNISVYELGGVYLQLCRLLSLEEHPFIQKPVDPSLFMHRFTSSKITFIILAPLSGSLFAVALIKDDDNYSKKVLQTALQFVASMKRDWMQTGRKPSGICGVALYVSTIVHGLKISKADILKVVHVCDATLTKRLIEFENTKSGGLTIEEFKQNAVEFEKEIQVCKQSDTHIKELGTREVLCEHKGKGPQSGYGLCKLCYLEFCGGLEGGSDPPAFQRAEMERISCASAEVVPETAFDLAHQHEKCRSEKEEQLVTEPHQYTIQNEKACLVKPTHTSALPGNGITNEDDIGCLKDMPANEDETDTLSDIDDVEVNCYINNEEESRFKKIIWEEMNKEYIQEQAIKEAAAAAARKLYSEASDEVRSAHELAAATAAALAKTKEKKRQKRAEEAKNAPPPQTAAEATRQMLTKKRLSSKINYEALDELFADSDPSAKKIKGGDYENSKTTTTTGKKLGKQENAEDEEIEEDMMGEDEYGVGGNEAYGNEQETYDYDYNNNEEQYGYDDDDDY